MSDKNYYRWDAYTREAGKPPFVLAVSDEEEIRIPVPSGAVLEHLARASRAGDLTAFLELITGDQWPRVKALTDSAPYEAAINLAIDMQDYFGFTDEYELKGPSGARVRVSNPREIKRLIAEGWVVAGER